MKVVKLQRVPHEIKLGHQPAPRPLVFSGDAILEADGEPIGLYLERLPAKAAVLLDIANTELLSTRVPKTQMVRSSCFRAEDQQVLQYSCILGSVPPKYNMRRPYATRSSVHRHAAAQTFVRAMLQAGRELWKVVERELPEQAAVHVREVQAHVPERWRFADVFTSTISNQNVNVPVHTDHGNVRGSLNMIACRRRNAKGGNLWVPDYDVAFEQPNNSLLVYPAWRNSHGVTPIEATHANGYRNSHIWYALNAQSWPQANQ